MFLDSYTAKLFASGVVGSLVVFLYWATGDSRILLGGLGGLLAALVATYNPED